MNSQPSNSTTAIFAPTEILQQKDFVEIVAPRVERLLALAQYLARTPLGGGGLTRPLLGEINSHASILLELFDAYGARNNAVWYPFRHLLSAAKLFSRVGYSLRHIRHWLPMYRLLESEGDIRRDTKEALAFTSDILRAVAAQLARKSVECGLTLPAPAEEKFDETLPKGRLPDDRPRREAGQADEIIAHLATEFLNLASESEILHIFNKLKPDDYGGCIPDPLNEETIRLLEHKFHSMQALYDTYVSDTETESLDTDLLYLRGHISIIFHLLEVATELTHYYERHLRANADDTHAFSKPIVEPRLLLDLLVEYPIGNASRYLDGAVALCQQMLRRYAEIGQITVPVPKYRGFHVRPSTLVAKICHHYGSEVKMDLGGEVYDASFPLDLFRANEFVNAEKRRCLAEEISQLPIAHRKELAADLHAAVQDVVNHLANDEKIVIYQRPLELEDLQPNQGDSLAQFALDEIARLLATGKIDIESDIEVVFIGDKRVLKDIETLARHGYGEDRFGNNIPLPKALSYLRR